MMYDVLVVGAGPAGAVAALLLAGSGRRVALVDCGAGSSPSTADWMTAPAAAFLKEIGIKHDVKLMSPFGGAELRSSDLSKCCATRERPAPGYHVDYCRLVERLRAAAKRAGADCLFEARVSAVEPGENEVVARVDGGHDLSGRFLLWANGARALDSADTEHQEGWIFTSSASVARGGGDDHMHWVLGLQENRCLGSWWYGHNRVHVRFHAPGKLEVVKAAHLRLLELLVEREHVPDSLVGEKADVSACRAPVKSALEVDSHVDKRSITIGDAGGFVASASREGIWPAMWSARLAAGVIDRAIDAGQQQDALRQFSSLWRTTMGEYLRSPNTEMSFLLPLVFNNQQMAERMAGAFWRGENI